MVLGTITRIEVREDRPPLSCVAVLQNRRIPNDMFFQLIEQIDYDIPGSNEEETSELIRDELRDEWSEYEAPDDVLRKTR